MTKQEPRYFLFVVASSRLAILSLLRRCCQLGSVGVLRGAFWLAYSSGWSSGLSTYVALVMIITWQAVSFCCCCWWCWLVGRDDVIRNGMLGTRLIRAWYCYNSNTITFLSALYEAGLYILFVNIGVIYYLNWVSLTRFNGQKFFVEFQWNGWRSWNAMQNNNDP